MRIGNSKSFKYAQIFIIHTDNNVLTFNQNQLLYHQFSKCCRLMRASTIPQLLHIINMQDLTFAFQYKSPPKFWVLEVRKCLDPCISCCHKSRCFWQGKCLNSAPMLSRDRTVNKLHVQDYECIKSISKQTEWAKCVKQ